jgi:hypothetical protein
MSWVTPTFGATTRFHPATRQLPVTKLLAQIARDGRLQKSVFIWSICG